MADEDYQSSPNERADQTPTPEELQAAELAKTRQALLVSAAMQQGEAQLPSRLPTQPAPPPQPGGTPAYEFGRGIGVLRPPAPPPVPPQPAPQGRMYMGPAMDPQQEAAFMQSAPGTRTNLMPPPPPQSDEAQAAMQTRMAAATGGESDTATLTRMQAADPEGSRTIGVQSEPKYSDASMANQQNAMRFEAMKKFDAGDHSPEVLAAAMGRSMEPMRNQTATKTPPRWVPADPKTGAPGHFETTEGAVRFAPTVRPAAVPKPPPMNTVRTVMPPDIPGGPSRTITERVPAGETRGTATATSANEEKRKTKDGRVAVYDAKTKRFIRYENAQ